MSDNYGGSNPVERPNRHPGGRSCVAVIAVPIALLALLMKAVRR